MLRDNLKNIFDILNNISNNYKYKEDNKLINETFVKINKLLSNGDNVTIEELDFINENIKYLDRTYDNLFELVNLYDPVYSSLKMNIHKHYVENLRKTNKQKENQK